MTSRTPGGWNAWKAVYSLSLLALAGTLAVAPALAQRQFDASAAEPGAKLALASCPLPGARDLAFAAVTTALTADSGDSGNRTLIKVALALGNRTVEIESPDGATIASLKSGDTIASLPPHSRWVISSEPGGALAFVGKGSGDLAWANSAGARIKPVAFLSPRVAPLQNSFTLPAPINATLTDSSGYVIVPGGEDPGAHLVACNGKLYRGCLWLKPGKDSGGAPLVSAVNVLDVEDYLLSVLPCEMPATWSSEALKAQAIAARSYAVANLGKHGKDGYDVKATIEDQVYQGVSTERRASNDAVAATNGLVLRHAGKVVSAFFHSTSGGCTELAEHVWGRQVPYLRSVVDYDDGSPHFAWMRKIKTNELEKIFEKDVGQLLSLNIVSRSGSNRVKDALVAGTKGNKIVSGDTLRFALKLPSSNFNIGCEENTYCFAGRGSGHGLGMSQWGAKALAEQGYNAAQILAYYYRDVSVEYMTGAPGI